TTRNRAKARTLPHDEMEPGHGTALPVQHQLVDARLLEADVAPRAFEAQGVVVRVGPDGAEAGALQLPAGRVRQGHRQLVAAPGQDQLRQTLERRGGPPTA